MNFDKETLTFTNANWETAQTVKVKLASQPSADTTITLSHSGADINPATLTFTRCQLGHDARREVSS